LVVVFYEVDVVYGQKAQVLEGLADFEAQEVGYFAQVASFRKSANEGPLIGRQSAKGFPGLLRENGRYLVAVGVSGRTPQKSIQPLRKLIITEVF
jgi:hypothetical protein